MRPITHGLPNRYPVAVAEVAYVGSHDLAAIGVTTVGSSVTQVEEVLDGVERFVWSQPDIEVVSAERTWMDLDR